jgi:hypothetical protein
MCTLFFVIILFSLPNASFSLDLNKVMFVCYSAVILELNSLTCSLKKQAMNIVQRCHKCFEMEVIKHLNSYLEKIS